MVKATTTDVIATPFRTPLLEPIGADNILVCFPRPFVCFLSSGDCGREEEHTDDSSYKPTDACGREELK